MLVIDSYFDALRALTKDKKNNNFNYLDEIDRKRLLNYFLERSGDCKDFIEKELYKNKKEKNRAIMNIIYSFNPCQVFYHKKIKNKLTNKQKEKAINRCLLSSKQSFLLFKNKVKLNNKQQREAIRSLSIINNNSDYIKNFLKMDHISIENKKYLINIIKNNRYDDYNNSYNDILIDFIYYKENNYNDEDRKLAINILFQQDDPKQCAKELFYLAKQSKLTKNEIQKIYDKYHSYYYDKFKYDFNNYYNFCKVFGSRLNKKEQKLMANKVMRENKKDRCKDVLENLNLNKKFNEKIQSYIIANKLK
jgi:hypothetical protein